MGIWQFWKAKDIVFVPLAIQGHREPARSAVFVRNVFSTIFVQHVASDILMFIPCFMVLMT
jgi:hypothetical protein